MTLLEVLLSAMLIRRGPPSFFYLIRRFHAPSQPYYWVPPPYSDACFRHISIPFFQALAADYQSFSAASFSLVPNTSPLPHSPTSLLPRFLRLPLTRSLLPCYLVLTPPAISLSPLPHYHRFFATSLPRLTIARPGSPALITSNFVKPAQIARNPVKCTSNFRTRPPFCPFPGSDRKFTCTFCSKTLKSPLLPTGYCTKYKFSHPTSQLVSGNIRD